MEATVNNVIIMMKTKYIKNISDILKRAEIQNLSTVSPTDLVQIVGEVVSVPKTVMNYGRDYEGFSVEEIKEGDIAVFRYDLVYNFRNTLFGESIYKNMFEYHAKEYWSCDIQKIFAVIRDGRIIMLNGYVMIEDFEEPFLILPKYLSKIKGACHSKILNIGFPKKGKKPIPAKRGDVVAFDKNKTAKYQINGKNFRIIQQNAIMGKIF